MKRFITLAFLAAFVGGCGSSPSTSPGSSPPAELTKDVPQEALDFLKEREPVETVVHVTSGEVKVEVTGWLLEKDGKADAKECGKGFKELTVSKGTSLKLKVHGHTHLLLKENTSGKLEVVGRGARDQGKNGSVTFTTRSVAGSEPDGIEVEGNGSVLIDGFGTFAAQDLENVVTAHRTELKASACKKVRAQDHATLSATNCDAVELLHKSKSAEVSECKLVEVKDKATGRNIKKCAKVATFHTSSAHVEDAKEVEASDYTFVEVKSAKATAGTAVLVRDAANAKVENADTVKATGSNRLTLSGCRQVELQGAAAAEVTDCPNVTASGEARVKVGANSQVELKEKAQKVEKLD